MSDKLLTPEQLAQYIVDYVWEELGTEIYFGPGDYDKDIAHDAYHNAMERIESSLVGDIAEQLTSSVQPLVAISYSLGKINATNATVREFYSHTTANDRLEWASGELKVAEKTLNKLMVDGGCEAMSLWIDSPKERV